ncbi:hypothetical protein BD0047_10840 [Helicobacter pylori]
MLTHTITINATHNMILLPILKPLDKTQPYYDEFFAHLRQNFKPLDKTQPYYDEFFAHLRQNFKPHYSILSINQKLNGIKKAINHSH